MDRPLILNDLMLARFDLMIVVFKTTVIFTTTLKMQCKLIMS